MIWLFFTNHTHRSKWAQEYCLYEGGANQILESQGMETHGLSRGIVDVLYTLIVLGWKKLEEEFAKVFT